jgi:hypothetical protein
MDVAFYQNDNLLEILGLQDAASGAWLNAATVTATIVDRAGVNVTGFTQPLSLAYVAASNGDYRATLPDEAALLDGRKYTAKISADAGAGLKGYWEFPFICKTRRD